MNSNFRRGILIILVAQHLFVFHACVKDKNFEEPKPICEQPVANAGYSEIKNMYVDETFQIQEDLIIEGYVTSSDQAGNFFSVLHFQDRSSNPTEGFQIEIDRRESYLFYPVGSKIHIKLKGLYLGRSKGVFKIGGIFTSFGNQSVGRLPAAVVDEHIFVACDETAVVHPTITSISELNHGLTNTLVQFAGIEILENELGETFALEREATERTLVDCDDNALILLNSGFSDFQADTLPSANGSITGVLLRENDNYQLVIRDLGDIDFPNERCEDLIDEFTSTRIFISELADPDNNAAARFVELYNAATEPIRLNGWQLHRYTNDNTEIGSTIDLSGHTIGAESTLVISPNATEFDMVYGFPADLGVGANTPADSNGDDNLQLVDPFGTVIDAFGIVGEDGSGTNHEFEDGRAVRNREVVRGNSTYTFTEWTIYNDTGGQETINQPQIAPDDFKPGERN